MYLFCGLDFSNILRDKTMDNKLIDFLKCLKYALSLRTLNFTEYLKKQKHMPYHELSPLHVS